MLGGTRTLKAGELLSVLGELYRNRESGTLVLQGDGATKYLYLQEGNVIFAASNASEDKFTHILTQEGKLGEQQLQMAMEKKGDRTIGKTLVELGFLSSADLLDALVQQVHRVACSALGWGEGTATFKPNVLPAGVAKLPLSTPRFILDLAQAVEDRGWVGQLLSGMESVLKVSPGERDAVVAIGLQPEERALLDLLDGKRSVRGACEEAHADLFKGAKFCLGLYVQGLVHPAGLLSHPHGQAGGKSLDLSFLDTMIPSAGGSDASGQVPFQAATAEPEPPAPPPEEVPPAEEAPLPPEPEAEPSLPAPPLKPGIKVPPKTDARPQLFADLVPPPEPPPSAGFRPTVERVSVKRKRGGSGRTLGLVAAAVIVVGGAAAGGWWWFMGRTPQTPPPPAPRPTPVAVPGPKPAPQDPLPAPTTAAPLPDGVTPGGTEPAATSSPIIVPAVPDGGPGTGAPQPPPAGAAPGPKPADPKPPTAASAGSKPPVASPPKPVAAPPSTGLPGVRIPLEAPEARRLLNGGRYHEAAGAFAYVARNTRAAFCVNIEVACQEDTVAKGLAAAAGDDAFFVLPYDLKGRACFVVLWGLYPDRPSAEAALAALPAFFRTAAQPRVVSWESVKK